MLFLPKLLKDIENMGQTLAVREQEQREAIQELRELLHTWAEEQAVLRQIAESEAGKRVRCAVPSDEPLDLALLDLDRPQRVTVIATDGSQIYPDRHGLAFYYLINIGGIVFRYGSGERPDTLMDPRMYYAREQVCPGGWPISPRQVNMERTITEMQSLVDLAIAEPADTPPLLTVVDGSLLAWVRRTTQADRRQEQALATYLTCLDQLHARNVAVMGYVSRPYSVEVVALLHLSTLSPEERQACAKLGRGQFGELNDAMLFRFLKPGERSALFMRGAAINNRFRNAGHGIYSYYLNTGNDIARIELPEWVARSPESLRLSQAVIHDQCVNNRGYPYVLTRADQIAFIAGAEREELNMMIIRALLKHGASFPTLSPKAAQKQVARRR